MTRKTLTKRYTKKGGPLLAAACCFALCAGTAGASDIVTYVAPKHTFSIDDIIGNWNGDTVAMGNPAICLSGDCPGAEPFIDAKTGVTLYPVDNEFGFASTDFVGGEQKSQDGIYEEGWAGNILDAAGEVVGLMGASAETGNFKAGAPKGTWCAGLGGNSVKCSAEQYVVMEHALTCSERIPYFYGVLVDQSENCAPLSDELTLPQGVGALDEMPANESDLINVAVGSDYGATRKDDGKLLYRWGTVVKRPTDLRMLARIPLPAEWKTPDAAFEVVKAELLVSHKITNNPNDQLRPEDFENEAATGRLPRYDEITPGVWTSTMDCYEGDGHFIPAGTLYRDTSYADPTAMSADLIGGFTNAWYTTIQRDPFEPNVVADAAGNPVQVSGPRWRLKSNKFGQNIPGLEIPLIECSPTPFNHSNIKYRVGEDTTTVLNLLDWKGQSPLMYSSGWTGYNGTDYGLAGMRDDVVSSASGLTVNGVRLTPDFDLTVYFKGESKPTTIYNAQLVIHYKVDDPVDFGDAPAPYPTLLAEDGARHAIVDANGDGLADLALGIDADPERDGLPDPAAMGDDGIGLFDDEDGVAIAPVIPGAIVPITVTANGTGGLLNGWFDFNRDGDWDDEFIFTDADGVVTSYRERIFVDQPLAAGVNELTMAVPPLQQIALAQVCTEVVDASGTLVTECVPELDGNGNPVIILVADGAAAGTSFARFRISSQAGLGSSGPAADGEVEDYAVEVAGDLDDIVGFDPLAGGVYVALSGGTKFATAKWATWSTTSQVWERMVVGDFNGDGHDDVARRNAATGWWDVALSDGVGSFGTAQNWGRWQVDSRFTWLDVMTGDFNGDGFDDIVGRRSDNGKWTALLSDGISFKASQIGSFSTTSQWPAVRSADCTGDGSDDIIGLQIDPKTGGAVWWVIAYSTGRNSFQSAKWGTWPAGAAMVDVIAGDFNGDGMADISARNSSTGNIFVSLTENYGVDLAQFRFAPQLNWGKWSVGTAWSDTLAGDFNADGMADLFTRDSAGKVMVALSTGIAFVTTQWEKWDATCTTVRQGDYNGDGRDDIAALDSSTWQWKVSLSRGDAFQEENWGAWKENATRDITVGDFN
ncbi:MAG: FG-GAP repeat domain-containing protein [Thermodesulfobacteriota bacterium]